MYEKSEAVKQARRELIQQTLDKIIETRDFNELRRTTYVVLAHLWLHKTAEEENLFKLEEWSKPECRDELIKKIREFLIKHIRQSKNLIYTFSLESSYSYKDMVISTRNDLGLR